MKEIFFCALKSLSRKRGRTLLTVCSIAVGVTMVVIVSFISGAGKNVVNHELESMGISGLSVSTNAAVSDQAEGGLTASQLETIRSLSDVETAMPLMIHYSTSVLRDTQSSSLICGLDSGARQVISLKLRYGRLISKSDVRSAAMVCVVDETVAKEAYRRSNITGKTILLQINGVMEEFTIVGISEAGSSLLQNVTDLIPGMIYIPYTTLQALSGRDTFDQIAVRVESGADVSRTESRILHTLERSTGLSGYYRTDNLAAQRD
ncbi:MAG: ABC transporter permease, partial [Clostridiales bacterium]|nr:ABC transporter permease [Clostridiales bacterium]